MSRVLVLQLDGKIPNLALLKVAAARRAAGDEVTFRKALTLEAVEPLSWDAPWDAVYASAVFSKTTPLARRVLEVYPRAVVGGSGWDLKLRLEDVGIPDETRPDYSDFPEWTSSIGFTHRGCVRDCSFCIVPAKEGKTKAVGTGADVWRGAPWPKRLLLLDNNFFSQKEWRERVAEFNAGGFEVSLTQGIDVRALTEEAAAAMASLKYRSMDFRSKRIYCAWDETRDEAKVIRGLERLIAHGVEPRSIMIYLLVGFDSKGPPDWLYRHDRITALGVMPYPMPYARTPQALGFCRWSTFGYWRRMTWAEWERDGYQAHAQRRRLDGAQQVDLFASSDDE